ncbi:MAG TPA: 4Fe-4S double cluster binding domain-containing protein [Thermoplasmata archaeon]|nr:4Fe-4S double cluster binding domain-containing protein [Thermoplasmata archaeon]
MTANNSNLRSRLEKAARRRGAVVFGIASAAQVDSMERVRIVDSAISAWSKRPSDVMPGARSIIVVGISAVDDADELAIRRSDGSWTYPGYNQLPLIARDMIDILKEEGYSGVIQPETVPRKRIAVAAGIGAYGKNSMILSEKYGLSLRLEIIVTDAPLVPDKPFKKDLCGDCVRCVKSCPAKAIVKPYVLDPLRCFVYLDEMGTKDEALRNVHEKFVRRLTPNTYVMCTICQMACPYTSAQRRKSVIRRSRTAR